MNGRAPGLRSDVTGTHLHAPAVHRDHVQSIEEWTAKLVSQAEAICRHKLTLFDLDPCVLGESIDWNYEYKARKRTPRGFSQAIDYRDYKATGDCLFVWRLNRHHHLVILGRAYRLTGDKRFARVVASHLDSWLEQCPYGMGMNWRSPMELGIRLINWIWAIELVRDSGVLDGERMRRLVSSAYRHLWEIARNYSRFSSVNNHLIGEAAGVFIGSSYFNKFRQASRWRRESRNVLIHEILSQTSRDGGTREQATGYHLFVIELLLLAGVVGRNTGEDFPQAYWERLEAMFEFTAALAEGGGTLPFFGDSDDGYVLDLGCLKDRAAGLLAVGAVVFGRQDFKRLAGNLRQTGEPVFWLLGHEGLDTLLKMDDSQRKQDTALQSKAFPETGCYLLQAGEPERGTHVSVTFDCGDLGLGPLAAHGHADALSFTLRAFGQDILIDPGTYDYFTYPDWRTYFRSTRAHNTIVIDGADQSEMLGPFLWGRRARSRCLHWDKGPKKTAVAGEHDGYGGLDGPVHHERTITLDRDSGEIRISDVLRGGGFHTAESYLHFAEGCALRRIGDNTFSILCDGGELVLQLDPTVSAEIVHGSESPKGGWLSRGYHTKIPTHTLVARSTWRGELRMNMRLIVVSGLDKRAEAVRGGIATTASREMGSDHVFVR